MNEQEARIEELEKQVQALSERISNLVEDNVLHRAHIFMLTTAINNVDERLWLVEEEFAEE